MAAPVVSGPGRSRQWHDVTPGAVGWSCSCGDSGEGGAAEADEHVLVAFAVENAVGRQDEETVV